MCGMRGKGVPLPISPSTPSASRSRRLVCRSNIFFNFHRPVPDDQYLDRHFVEGASRDFDQTPHVHCLLVYIYTSNELERFASFSYFHSPRMRKLGPFRHLFWPLISHPIYTPCMQQKCICSSFTVTFACIIVGLQEINVIEFTHPPCFSRLQLTGSNLPALRTLFCLVV